MKRNNLQNPSLFALNVFFFKTYVKRSFKRRHILFITISLWSFYFSKVTLIPHKEKTKFLELTHTLRQEWKKKHDICDWSFSIRTIHSHSKKPNFANFQKEKITGLLCTKIGTEGKRGSKRNQHMWARNNNYGDDNNFFFFFAANQLSSLSCSMQKCRADSKEKRQAGLANKNKRKRGSNKQKWNVA